MVGCGLLHVQIKGLEIFPSEFVMGSPILLVTLAEVMIADLIALLQSGCMALRSAATAEI